MNNVTMWLTSIIPALICVMIGAHGISWADGGERRVEGHRHEERGGDSESGEEDSARYALDETYDTIRAGARLLMNYDAESHSFYGLVQNTTEDALSQVRVEVHLSNGMELGPTAPMDMEPGEIACVILLAPEEPFDSWTPHAEVGDSERENG